MLYRRVGVAVADVDFLNIDIDPCGSYVGDDGPNFFSGIDRCHKESTIVSTLREPAVVMVLHFEWP